MPIRPVPFITLHVDKKENGANENHDGEEGGEEHYHFDINEEAAKMLQSIEEPVSVCFFLFFTILCIVWCAYFVIVSTHVKRKKDIDL